MIVSSIYLSFSFFSSETSFELKLNITFSRPQMADENSRHCKFVLIKSLTIRIESGIQLSLKKITSLSSSSEREEKLWISAQHESNTSEFSTPWRCYRIFLLLIKTQSLSVNINTFSTSSSLFVCWVDNHFGSKISFFFLFCFHSVCQIVSFLHILIKMKNWITSFLKFAFFKADVDVCGEAMRIERKPLNKCLCLQKKCKKWKQPTHVRPKWMRIRMKSINVINISLLPFQCYKKEHNRNSFVQNMIVRSDFHPTRLKIMQAKCCRMCSTRLLVNYIFVIANYKQEEIRHA